MGNKRTWIFIDDTQDIVVREANLSPEWIDIIVNDANSSYQTTIIKKAVPELIEALQKVLDE